MLLPLLVTTLLVASDGAAPSESAPDRLLPFAPQVHTLGNGLQVVVVPRATPGLVAYYTLVRVGSRDEVEKGVTGFAHFFEHMMFRGSKNWPPERVQALLKKAGADQNGFTTDDFTCYTFLGAVDALDELMDYESDRIQNLAYEEKVFKTEAGAVYGEYRKNSSNAYLPLQEKLRSNVFKKSTYGHTTLGYLADIKKMPEQYKYSLKFFERYYTPDNTVLIVVGDVKFEDIKAQVEAKYGAWTGKRHNNKIPKDRAQRREIRTKIAFGSPTLPRLSMSWRTPASDFKSKETAVYNLLYELLFGSTSALHQSLVLDKGWVAGFSEYSWNHKDPYMFQVVATVKAADQLKAIEKAMSEAVSTLIKDGVSEDRLNAVKSHVRYASLLGLQTPNDVAYQIAFVMGAGGGPDDMESFLRAVDSLTPKDVQTFAKKFLVNKNRAVATLAGPKGAS